MFLGPVLAEYQGFYSQFCVFETSDASGWLWPQDAHESQGCEMERDPQQVHILVLFSQYILISYFECIQRIFIW